MNISEMIKRLKEIESKYGDVTVLATEYHGYITDVEEINICSESNKAVIEAKNYYDYEENQ